MQIPMHEAWSPELVSELQRAMPMLEAGDWEFLPTDGQQAQAHTNISLASSPRNSESHSPRTGTEARHSRERAAGTWPPRILPAGRHAYHIDGSPRPRMRRSDTVDSDMLSEDAMALPMSTLTSGKRKTYPNRSSFQAHVCCVMDPLQVTCVLDRLQENPHLQSARYWPYAYRIISPFDGQTHEGCGDGDDLGAGEKMLGLLKRMELENLLIVVSRWDSGPADRLGTELFKCINEQCKELLRELQQAVRASFPPEELLASSQQDRDVSSCIASDTELEFSEFFDNAIQHGAGHRTQQSKVDRKSVV